MQGLQGWEAARLNAVPHQWRRRVERQYMRRRAEFERTAAGGYVLADRIYAEIAADSWLEDVAGIFRRSVIQFQASDSDIRAKANECAGRAMDHAGRVQGGVDAVRAALSLWVSRLGINPPGERIEDRPAVARMTCPLWWRRALRTSQARELERGGIALGFVHHRGEVYATDAAVDRRQQQRTRNAEALEATEAVNLDTGDIYTLASLAAVSVANPRIRRGELMTRISGFEHVARGLGHACEFTTITCPSRFHAMRKTDAGGGARNRKHDGSTPREAQRYLCKVWARTRAALARLGVAVYGFRIAEPHHDGCPHWHILAFMEAGQVETWRAKVRHYALEESPDEPGAQERRCTFVAIDPAKGSAAGYVAKYVSKNIDGGGYQVQGDIETGRDAVYPGRRVDAWAATWGIRQFQQIGGPPVGVWRELRRMKESEDKPDALNAAISAADCGRNGKDENGTAGNWRRYVELQGGPTLPRKFQRFGVARTRAGERWDSVNKLSYPAPATRYGDAAQPAAFGVLDRFKGRAWESMRYRWQVQGRGKNAGQSSVDRVSFVALHGEHLPPCSASTAAAVRGQGGAEGDSGLVGSKAPRTRVNNCTRPGEFEPEGRFCLVDFEFKNGGWIRMVEEKARQAAALAKKEAAHPLLPGGARRAIEAMADALEALAHEVEILKIRAKGGEHGEG